jgi:hypothetical protein
MPQAVINKTDTIRADLQSFVLLHRSSLHKETGSKRSRRAKTCKPRISNIWLAYFISLSVTQPSVVDSDPTLPLKLNMEELIFGTPIKSFRRV